MYLILIVILAAIFAGSASNGASHCTSAFPSSGTFSTDPPHWTPDGCTIRTFDKASAIQCLKGKTVYVIGSSIARNYAFELAQLLGAEEMTRTDQKQKCQHTAYSWDGCVNEIEGIKFRVLYLQYLDGFEYSSRGGFKHLNERPKPSKAAPPRPAVTRNRLGPGAQRNEKPRSTRTESTKDDLLSLPYSYNYPKGVSFSNPKQLQKWSAPLDVCYNISAMECLTPFFQGSSSNDVLILSVGINYAVNMVDFSLVNYTSWISESAVNFKRAVDTLFKGRMFRGTMSEVRNLKHDLVDYNRYIWRTEKLLSSIWTNSGASSSAGSGGVPWFTVDQWAINRGRADQYYQDFIHFPGPLTRAFLHNTLSEYCQ